MLILYFPTYTTTHLEDWVSDWYLKLHITIPSQLMAYTIARKYETFLHRKPVSPHYEVFGRFRAITVDSRRTKEVQREQFYHEFCHLLRHVGKQTMMPPAFRELQERDARHFTFYAALPYHMISQYDINNPNLLDQWVKDFRVTTELCRKRLQQIKERENRYILNKQ
nr:ImmA/IrrE family metallo-endopeptidase [Halobacillus shinanisalinarum]